MNDEIQKISSSKGLIEDFQLIQERTKVNKDHSEALHANRVAKRMARKVVRMTQKGIATRPTFIGPLGLPSTRDVDSETATLALNAELKEVGAPIQAELYRNYDYDGQDMIHTLRVTRINDTNINESYIAADKKDRATARAIGNVLE